MLINGIFFFTALFSIISLLISQKFIPQFLVEVGQSEKSLTGYFFRILEVILMMIIYLRLISYKEFRFSIGAKIGLILLIINTLIPIIIECLYTFYDFDNTHMLYSALYGCNFFFYLIGIIMFIKRCDIDEKLKRFIIWTPFISLILSVVIAFAGVLRYENGNFIQDTLYVIMNIAFFLIINRMSRKELKVA